MEKPLEKNVFFLSFKRNQSGDQSGGTRHKSHINFILLGRNLP